MKLLIIRHGDPDYENDTLTEKGRREAELLAERLSGLKVKAAYCSPLGRARDTAAPSLKKLGINYEIIDWLREFDGYIIDPDTGEKRIPWDLMPAFWTACEEFYDRGKWLDTPLMRSGNVREKYERACAGLDGLLEKHGYRRDRNIYRAENANNDTLLFFCHFGVECVLLSHLLGISPVNLWHGFTALTSSVTTLVTEEREKGSAYFRCCGFGDLSHLYAAGEPASFAARFCETYSNTEERH